MPLLKIRAVPLLEIRAEPLLEFRAMPVLEIVAPVPAPPHQPHLSTSPGGMKLEIRAMLVLEIVVPAPPHQPQLSTSLGRMRSTAQFFADNILSQPFGRRRKGSGAEGNS